MPEADLWFLPDPAEDPAPADPPWPGAAREASLDPASWHAGEAAQYQGLIAASEALVRFGERVRGWPVAERFALGSISAVMRSEGIWLSPEQIALYRALRAPSDDSAQDMARANWALRRLLAGGNAGPADGLRAFLGRVEVAHQPVPLGEARPTGLEFDALGDHWVTAITELGEVHPLTRAAYGFAQWRGLGLTPWEELLEPTVAAMRIGAGTLAPFLPMVEGHRFDRHGLRPGAGGAEARLRTFYAAVQAGALQALLQLDRLTVWHGKARAATADLSGRTPPALIEVLMRLPVVSAELAAAEAGCSRPSARRNLTLFHDRGLIRETTGQERYRFWTVQL